MEVGDNDLDCDNIPDVEDILSVCAGLVTVDEESQVIRLVHYTTQDFLEGIRGNWTPNAQRDISSVCLTYLCFEPFKSGASPNNERFDDRLAKYRFLDYSARFWQFHAATVQEQILDLALIMLEDSNLVDCVLQTTYASTHQYFGSYSQSYPAGSTGLHLVASLELLHFLVELLSWVEEEKMILVDAKNADGQTPLMWAAQDGQRDAAELLLCTGQADVEARDKSDGNTPLIKAAASGHKSVVELLLSTGTVDVDASNELGKTPLMYAASNGHKDIAELLLSTGKVDIDARDKSGETPLMYAAEGGNKDTVELLLSTGKVHVDARTTWGSTPLMEAAGSGYEAIVGMLLETGMVDINAKNDEGNTPLLLAARRGHRNVVEKLLSCQNIMVDVKDNAGWTPLALAARRGHKDIVQLLLDIGKADVDLKGRNDRTALGLAEQRGHGKVARILRAHLSLK